ncbi:MAG: P1 family peptidase [Gemmatimonadota bacterium]|nr:MAG: P1 family peptidase [Gemmatimonadota bacterium]
MSPARAVLLVTMLLTCAGSWLTAQERRSARDLGITVGVLQPGVRNAITDVAGVRVGQVTVTSGDSINTGVTAVLPHGGNVFREKVPAAVVIGNAFGKLAGSTQVQELGELESPVVLTCTLCVPRAADAVLTYLLSLPGNENVRSANPVVGETNDGYLNHIRLRPISETDVLNAINGADTGLVDQGSVGAGRGTIAFGWKGGIGTSSRKLPRSLGGWTVGVMVQSNFGGVLSIAGAPVGQELGRYYLRGIGGEGGEGGEGDRERRIDDTGDGSIMIVVATDAPVGSRNLSRLGRRALAGLARTGSAMTNGSGDFVIVFSTVPVAALATTGPLGNDQMSPLFEAVIEATEEAIYNSLFLASAVKGYRGTVEALPLDSTLAVLKRYGVVKP